MKHKKFIAMSLVAIALIAAAVYGLRDFSFPIFQTQGHIAAEQKKLILITLALSLVVVVPVFSMLIFIVWKYRDHQGSEYKPDWDGSRLAETVWWTVPLVLITILAVITWQSSHSLDPFKPIASNNAPVRVQVVSLDWKWLFIYPDQHVASLNELRIPSGRPVHFDITGDSAMNSFWVPALGGQVYAMAGMSTQLSLVADKPGTYKGLSANLSGKGFSDMHFQTIAQEPDKFDQWIAENQRNNNLLNSAEYNKLAQPSVSPPVTYYALKEDNLYNKVMVKYMVPGHTELKSSDDPEALMASIHKH